MRFRLICALTGVFAVLVGHTGHLPAVVAVGVAAWLPLLAKLAAVPAAGRRSAFVLTALAFGLLMVAAASHRHTGPDHRPVAAAAVHTAITPTPNLCTPRTGRR